LTFYFQLEKTAVNEIPSILEPTTWGPEDREPSPHQSIEEMTKDFTFTFRSPIGLSNGPSLKQPVKDDNVVTPTESPITKRARTDDLDENLPSGFFATQPFLSKEPDQPTKNGMRKLTTYWGVETKEMREERNWREIQELNESQEARNIVHAHWERCKKDKKRDGDRECQQRRRDVVHERKTAEGWVPGKK
jgi:hypothetical protein